MSDIEPRDLAEFLKELAADAENYEPCMSLHVCEHGQSVELMLGLHDEYYGEWINGEGADICLYRSELTGKVVGVHLPLYNRKLAVFHDGPVKINEGFRKGEQ